MSLSSFSQADRHMSASNDGPNVRPTYWFDVEDILFYFATEPRPTGIQRVSMELLALVHQHAPDRFRFCRVSFGVGHVEMLEFPVIEAAWLKPPAANFLETCARWAKHFLWRPVIDRLRGRQREKAFARMVKPGDVMICLGSPMLDGKYNANVASAKRRLGIRYTLLLHDILPVVAPDMFDRSLLKPFQAWLPDVVAICDLILVSSQHGRNELLNYGVRNGVPMPPLGQIRFGAGFSTIASASEPSNDPLPERFVLFVATIEIRKNHRLLLRVWRRLIEKHGAGAVPTLLFVGRMGWMVADLMAELRASNFLDGKIVLKSGIADIILQRAYERCLFTVYPSFCEGWGLPVAESLAHGKLCIASNRTSIPEVGGDFVDYIDPESEESALAAVERALFEEGYVEARNAYIRANYKPRDWSECFDDLLAALHRNFDEATSEKSMCNS
jgi:glycosyltransferase involved in cell wall biosynthesis